MWFWVGSLRQDQEKDLLWHPRLHVSAGGNGVDLQQRDRCLGCGSADFLVADRKGAFLPPQQKQNDEVHPQCTYFSIQCEFELP